MSKPDLPTIPFEVFGEQFENLLLATINKIEREWPARWAEYDAAYAILERMLRVARNTWQSLRFLCSQEPRHHTHKAEYSLAAAPMVRSNLEILFAIIFLFDDLDSRSRWFVKAGWREVDAELVRCRELYGQDEEWRQWLDGFAEMAAVLANLADLTKEERERPENIRWWPTPGRMIKYRDLSNDRKAFMQFLDDWHYKHLSSQHHLSMPGLVMASQGLLPRARDDEDYEWKINKQRSDVIASALVLTLAILTEINHEARYDLNDRLAYVWGFLVPDMGIANELFDRRYKEMVK